MAIKMTGESECDREAKCLENFLFLVSLIILIVSIAYIM